MAVSLADGGLGVRLERGGGAGFDIRFLCGDFFLVESCQ